jgi:hypothetical protein
MPKARQLRLNQGMDRPRYSAASFGDRRSEVGIVSSLFLVSVLTVYYQLCIVVNLGPSGGKNGSRNLLLKKY